jgi:hypothetical protein
MGAETAYVFRFQVGEIRDGEITPVKSRRIPPEIALDSLVWVWHRIWSRPSDKTGGVDTDIHEAVLDQMCYDGRIPPDVKERPCQK